MAESKMKQKIKIGISVGILIIVSNLLGLVLTLLAKKLNIVDEDNQIFISYIINAISIYVVGFCVFKYVLKKVERVENKEKKKLEPWQIVLFVCIVIGATQFVNLVSQGIISVVKSVLQIEITNNVAKLLKASSPILNLIFAVLLGPIFEELMFRGMLLKRLRVYGDKTAIIYTAIMFGLFHCNIEQIPYVVACGLILGYAYTRTNSIIYPIVFHICMNGFSILLSTFYKYEMTSAMTVQIMLLLVMIILAIIAIPILITTGKIKITNKTVYNKKKLYNNVGFITTVVITIIFTVLSNFNIV